MVPYITHHTLMEIGALFDILQLILLLVVAYILLCIVRMLRQLQAIGRFWLRSLRSDRIDPRTSIGASDSGTAEVRLRDSMLVAPNDVAAQSLHFFETGRQPN